MNTDKKGLVILVALLAVLSSGWLGAAPADSNAPAKEKARILLVTGMDYPGPPLAADGARAG